MSERLRAQFGLTLALIVLVSTMSVLVRGSVSTPQGDSNSDVVHTTKAHTQPTHLASTGR
jgi:hypothetical protein